MKKTNVKDSTGRFELTGETRKIGKTVVYRIRAVKPFTTGKDGRISVRKGDLGGFVSDPERISDNAWVMGDAVVMGDFDFAVYMNTWSSGRYVTYTRSNKM